MEVRILEARSEISVLFVLTSVNGFSDCFGLAKHRAGLFEGVLGVLGSTFDRTPGA